LLVYLYTGVGDTNGDGFSDVVGGLSSQPGTRVYFGARMPCPSSGCTRFVPLTFVDSLGGAIDQSGVGDVDGDGFDDMVVLFPFAGSLYLLYGSPAGPPPEPSRTFTFEQGFAYAVAHL
jgi:hypothetical protein